jgi:hypothetical protein
MNASKMLWIRQTQGCCWETVQTDNGPREEAQAVQIEVSTSYLLVVLGWRW